MAMPSIFLSYARQDLHAVEPLAQQLRALGCSVWRDQDSLRGGQHWPKIIGEAIEAHEVFLLVWSHHAARSHFVEVEWNTAMATRKPFLPCVLDETPLHAALRMTHAVDVRSLAGALPHIQAVLQQFVSGGAAHEAPLRPYHDAAAPAGLRLVAQDRIGHATEHAYLVDLYAHMATQPHGHIVWVTAHMHQAKRHPS
jgi:hypothetical protein